MPADKKQRIGALAEKLAPEAREPLKELLNEKQIIDRKEFARLNALLVDAFDETLTEDPNQKRMDRKLRELLSGMFNLQYEGEVQDEVLRRAVKFIREKLVRNNEKDKLARLLSKEVIESWLSMDDNLIEHIAGFDGLLEQLQDKVEGPLDFADDEFLDIMIETYRHICANYMERLDEGTFNTLLDQAIEVCTLLENDGECGDQLLALTKSAMQSLGFIAMMRRAFSGLLLSDLVVRQIGKSLGIEEKLSVTDFIIFVGVKVVEKEHLPTVEKSEVTRIKKVLEDVKTM